MDLVRYLLKVTIALVVSHERPPAHSPRTRLACTRDTPIYVCMSDLPSHCRTRCLEPE